jgi:CheY-like chemotaxis protein
LNRNHTILLVEDNSDDVLLLQRACKSMPVREWMRVVPNATEAMRYLLAEGPFADRSQFPFPDVLVLDLSLPGMDALEFLKWIRAESPAPNLPVIVLSGYAGNSKFEDALQLGCKKFFVKPQSDSSRLREICEEIQKCCLE